MTLKVGIITDSIERGPTSIGNYTRNLVKALLKIKNNETEIILIHEAKSSDPIYDGAKEVIASLRKNDLPLFRIVSSMKAVQETLRNLDVVHIPHLAGAVAPPLAFAFKNFISLIVTLHGVAPLVVPPKLYYEGRAYVQRALVQVQVLKWKLFFKNNSMIAVSFSEKRNIVNKLNIPEEKIKVIYHGIDHENFRPMNDHEVREELHQKYGIDFDFILHVSSFQPKKNVEGIVRAFSILKKKYKIRERFVILGKQPESIKVLVEDLGLSGEVIFPGHVPYEDLPKFYNLATTFIFPSFHEGFGMPILEAMACGCPVITSNIFSMPEIAGEAAILVNPYDVREIAEAIFTLISDESLRRELSKKGLKRAKQFTWERCAKEHLKVYGEVYHGI